MTDPRHAPTATSRATMLRWLAATTVYWAALFVGTHTPPTSLPGTNANDKVLHFGAYFGLTLLLVGTLRRGFRSSVGRAYALGVLTALSLAAFDELTQPLMRRICDPWDWVADAVGAGAAVSADWLRRRLAGFWPRSAEP